MSDRLHTRFIAMISVAALVITGLNATAARADSRDAAKWIAGIAAAAIIGAAIADNNKKKRQRRQQAHDDTYTYQRQPGHSGKHDDYYTGKNDRGHARPVPHEVRRKLLPGRCLVRGETRRGAVRGFGRNCLNRNYAFTNSLPQRCAVRALNRNGKYHRVIYRQRCLNKFGYQVAHR